MEKVDDYKFLQLKDAISSLNQKVNLIGVILEYGIPKHTKGTDFCLTLTMIDESHHGPGIPVNFFSEYMEDLPRIKSPGDIVLLSNVMMKTYEKDVYVLFKKKFSSFALFEGKHGKDLSPYHVSRKFFCGSKDKSFVISLRKWLEDFRLDTGQKESILLREIKQGERIDVVCKILHVCEVAEGEWMVFIWDGTDTPPMKFETSLEDEKDRPLPLHLEPLPLERDVICMFPTVGTVLRVVAEQGNENLSLKSLTTGKWAKFLNIVFEVHAGLWRGVVMPFTKVRYVPNEDIIVSQRQRSNDERVKSKWDRMPFTSFDWPSTVTEVDYGDNVPFVTLMDVMTYSEVSGKFRCVVRVAAIYPWEPKDLCSPRGIYRIRLTLEDPTARMHAFVYAEDGEQFFEGYPSMEELKWKRNRLLGVANDDGPRNPPWVQCCLKSYYLSENDIWGSRNYRIYGTKIIAAAAAPAT